MQLANVIFPMQKYCFFVTFPTLNPIIFVTFPTKLKNGLSHLGGVAAHVQINHYGLLHSFLAVLDYNAARSGGSRLASDVVHWAVSLVLIHKH